MKVKKLIEILKRVTGEEDVCIGLTNDFGSYEESIVDVAVLYNGAIVLELMQYGGDSVSITKEGEID